MQKYCFCKHFSERKEMDECCVRKQKRCSVPSTCGKQKTLFQRKAFNAFSQVIERFVTDIVRNTYSLSLSKRIFIISQAALATEVPGPKMAATPALYKKS